VNSAFEEFVGEIAVCTIVRHALTESREKMKFEKTRKWDEFMLGALRKVAELETKREAWEVQGFEVVVDEADFGFCVGEVELCEEVVMEKGEKVAYEGMGRGIESKMDAKIEEFMEKYAWAFPKGRVMGKLSAYFKQKEWTDLGM